MILNVTQVFRPDSEESKCSVSRVRPKGLSYINSVDKTNMFFFRRKSCGVKDPLSVLMVMRYAFQW